MVNIFTVIFIVYGKLIQCHTGKQSKCHLVKKFIDIYKYEWIPCTDLQETNGYCSGVSQEEILNRMKQYPANAIHFIDSGNYHYLTKLWLEKVKEPFTLVLFDHHPDTQDALVHEMLSCGGWVKKVMKDNPYLKQVLLLGVKSEAMIEDKDLNHDMVRVYTKEALKESSSWEAIKQEKLQYPMYISIDKDVFSTQFASTNWDQGMLSLEEFKQLLALLLEKQKVIGVDVSGECACTSESFLCSQEVAKNNKLNHEILQVFQGVD